MQRNETARRTVALSPRATGFLTALLSGKRISEACKLAGISRSTGIRLRRNPDFQNALRESRDELLVATISGLHSAAADCVATLHAIAIDEKAKGSDRVLAARHGLDLLLRGVETLDFAERIGRLEQVSGREE